MSPDIDTARAAVLQHYHPDATFYQHAAEVGWHFQGVT